MLQTAESAILHVYINFPTRAQCEGQRTLAKTVIYETTTVREINTPPSSPTDPPNGTRRMLGYAISELESLESLPGRDDFIGKFFNARHAAELTHKWHERTLAVSAGERRRHFRGLPC